MNEFLETCLNSLSLNSMNKNDFEKLVNSFIEYSSHTEYVKRNQQDIALVFYKILCVCRTIYETELDSVNDGLPTDLKGCILKIFANIEHVGVEYREKKKKQEISTDCKRQDPCSQMQLIWFLSELKNKGEENQILNIEQSILVDYIDELLDILDDISFVFDFQENGRMIFPIHQLVSTAIKDEMFITGQDGVSKENLRILQLAVKLFHKYPEEGKLLLELESKCNLKFIQYLTRSCTIIDSYDMDNYQRNHVMIFFDSTINASKILIRSEKQNYFKTGDFLNSNKTANVQEERDYKGARIGWFVEIPLAPNDRLVDYSDVMRERSGRKQLLRLIFDHHCCNVFIEKALVLRSDGTIVPTNPYCKNDEVVVKCRLKRNKKAAICAPDKILDFLQEYRTSVIQSDNSINRLSFGLCFQLLNINNIGVDGLMLTELQNNTWYQSQVIDAWLKNESVDEAQVREFLGIWYKQLMYCESGVRGIEANELQPIDVFPYQQALDTIYKKICADASQKERIYCGRVTEDKGGGFYIDVIMQNSIASEELRDRGVHQLFVESVCVDNKEGIINWEADIDTDVYFLYSVEEKTGHVVEQSGLKLLNQIEKIMRALIPFEVSNYISGNDYDDLAQKMMLFQDTFISVAQKTKVCLKEDLSTQIFIRVIHNILWTRSCGILRDDSSNIKKYFEIIRAHQKVCFDEIINDDVFNRSQKGTLYLPKDRENKGSVLSDVYYNYLRNRSCREQTSLYDQELTQDGDECYLIKGEIINRIVILTDNFVYGYATKKSIADYLGIPLNRPDAEDKKNKINIVNKGKINILTPVCGNKRVNVSEILERNKGTKIFVYGYFGTKEGKNAIDEFLKSSKVDFEETQYAHELCTKVEDKLELAKLLWGNDKIRFVKEKSWMFIRQFNMPKQSVFPEEMLNDPSRAICLFVRKSEL